MSSRFNLRKRECSVRVKKDEGNSSDREEPGRCAMEHQPPGFDISRFQSSWDPRREEPTILVQRNSW